MRIFVTGATGYIGSAIVRELVRRGDEVRALVRNQESVQRLPDGVIPVHGDLTGSEDWLGVSERCDAFVHTAFPAHGRDWSDAVEAEKAFLEALVERWGDSERPVIATNGSIFLGDSGERRLDETAPIQHTHPAARRALSLEHLRTRAKRGIELRLASFVYGRKGSVFLPVLLDSARLHGESLVVRGSEGVRTSALHVDAAARAYLSVLDDPASEGVYHVASEEDPTTLAIAQAVAIAVGGVEVVPVAAEVAAQRLDPFTTMFLTTNNRLDASRIRTLGWHHTEAPSLLWDLAHGSYAHGRGTF